MSRLVATFQVIVLLAGALLLTVPPELACCADLVEIHGSSCCETSDTDTRALICCEREGAALLSRLDLPTPPAHLSQPVDRSDLYTLPETPLTRQTALGLSPPNRGLFTLHSSLLL